MRDLDGEDIAFDRPRPIFGAVKGLALDAIAELGMKLAARQEMIQIHGILAVGLTIAEPRADQRRRSPSLYRQCR